MGAKRAELGAVNDKTNTPLSFVRGPSFHAEVESSVVLPEEFPAQLSAMLQPFVHVLSEELHGASLPRIQTWKEMRTLKIKQLGI